MTIAEFIRQLPGHKFPAALVAAFLLQTAGALYWGQRRRTHRHPGAHYGVGSRRGGAGGGVAEQVRAIKDSVERIERKIDGPQ